MVVPVPVPPLKKKRPTNFCMGRTIPLPAKTVKKSLKIGSKSPEDWQISLVPQAGWVEHDPVEMLERTHRVSEAAFANLQFP